MKDFLKVIEVLEFKEMNISDTNSLISILANYGYLVEVKEKYGSRHVVIYERVDPESLYEPVKATVWENHQEIV